MAGKGKKTERLIATCNARYANTDKALIQRVSDPITITAQGDMIRTKSTVDFLGTLKGGKAIAIEVKEYSSKPKTFPFSNVEQHQDEFLEKMEELGGLAYLAIKHKELDYFYLITYSEYASYKLKNTRKSIPFKDLERFRKTGLKDYLDLM
jgi:recombination protein U